MTIKLIMIVLLAYFLRSSTGALLESFFVKLSRAGRKRQMNWFISLLILHYRGVVEHERF